MQQVTDPLALLPAAWQPKLAEIDPLHILYAPGEMICQSGSYVAGFHLVASGVVCDLFTCIDRTPGACELLGPGDLLGIDLFADPRNARSPSICKAITAVSLIFYERRAFEQAILDDPSLSAFVLHHIAGRHSTARRSAFPGIPDTRLLARVLKRLGECCGSRDQDGSIELPPEISLRTLAEICGWNRRRLRDALREFSNLEDTGNGIRFLPEVTARLASSTSRG